MYARADGDLPGALRLAGPLASTERTGPLARTERTGPFDSNNGYAGAAVDLHGDGRTDVPEHAGPFDSNVEQPMLDAERFDLLHVNVQGLCSHLPELTARLRAMSRQPAAVCVNESFLDASIGFVELEGYSIVARRDRKDGRQGGGVIVFARTDIANRLTLVEESMEAERVWLLLHSTTGPYLICAWYRPPDPGEVGSINTLRAEWLRHVEGALGTLIIGDLNVHHKGWLRYSSRNSAEGTALRDFCNEMGLQQLVKSPTRKEYLLDLVLSDVGGILCKVLPRIADHELVLTTLALSAPKSNMLPREVWQFATADWEGLSAALCAHDWSRLSQVSACEGASILTETILSMASNYIPKRFLQERKSTHPWLNDRAMRAVAAKQAARGTDRELEEQANCSACILEEYNKYVDRERERLKSSKQDSKAWWARTRRLLQQKGVVTSIPALKDGSGTLLFDSKLKADEFVASLASKFVLPVAHVNDYSEIEPSSYRGQAMLPPTTQNDCAEVLRKLDIDSGTGPDLLPARILKVCYEQLSLPVFLLFLRILETGCWPTLWLNHWIVPIYKKRIVYSAANYRGIHLTAQLSKVMERLLQKLFVPYLRRMDCFGPNQFAYTAGRGARDALAYLVLTWVTALSKCRKVAVYCSDVSGAFDKVDAKRLLAKLRAQRVHENVISIIASWLRRRSAYVVVGGEVSKPMTLVDMIFQGTVLGPSLWNLFYGDAKAAIQQFFFSEIVYADDLNSYRVFGGATSNGAIRNCMDKCQVELHSWGHTTQVTFDPAKESKHILSMSDADAEGGDFKILGVTFDCQLDMSSTVDDLVCSAGWKMRTILRTRRLYCSAELVQLYKTNLLPYLEYRTPAVYHARRQVLTKLDRVQTRFLRDAGVSELEALMEFSLAPLETRRDIALLGLVHRAVLGIGPAHFKEFFVLSGVIGQRHRFHLKEVPCNRLLSRSAIGLIAVYNLLPSWVVETFSVKCFQGKLQSLVKSRATEGCGDWALTLSPRHVPSKHPLL